MGGKNLKRILFAAAALVFLCAVLPFFPGCSPFVGRESAVTPNIWPVSKDGAWISSEYGGRHHPILGKRIKHAGIDIAVDKGTPVYATADGKVIFAGWENGYGNLIKIDHGDSLFTYYAHLSVKKVNAGDDVRKGDLIAYSGNSGRVTGDHLHYEIRYHGKTVNPKWALP